MAVPWYYGRGRKGQDLWTFTRDTDGDTVLKNAEGVCLQPGVTSGSAVTIANCADARATLEWVLRPIPKTSGAEAWQEWFVPYIDMQLMTHSAVQAFCYIDRNWRSATRPRSGRTGATAGSKGRPAISWVSTGGVRWQTRSTEF